MKICKERWLVALLWLPVRCFRYICHRTAGWLKAIASFGDPLWVTYPRKITKYLERNRKTHNSLCGRACFILGNGPSLLDINLGSLASEIVLCVNGFYLHPDAQAAKPGYYVLSGEIFSLEAEIQRRFIAGVLGVSSTMHIVTLLENAETIIKHKLLPLDRVSFIPQRGTLRDKPPTSLDLVHPVPSGVNVIQGALLTAMHLGCNPIYLLGIEHDWLAARNEFRHFYNTCERDPKIRYMEQVTYYEKIKEAEEAWQGHIRLQAFAQKNGFNIINLTPGSYLDVYEQRDLKTVLSA